MITLASYVPGGAGATSGACRSGSCAAQRIVYPEASRGLVRQARLSANVYQTLLTIGRRNGTVVRCVPSLLSFQPCSLRRRRQRKIRFPFLPTMAESFSPISTERVTERSCLRTRALQQRELDDAG